MNVCRLCLQGNVPLYDMVDPGLKATLEKITQIVLNTAGYPQAVCMICRAYLKKCVKLINMSSKSEKVLHSIAKNKLSTSSIESEYDTRVPLCMMVMTNPEINSFESNYVEEVQVKEEQDYFKYRHDEESNDDDAPIASLVQIKTEAVDYNDSETTFMQQNEEIFVPVPSAYKPASDEHVCVYCKQVFDEQESLDQHVFLTHKVERVDIKSSHTVKPKDPCSTDTEVNTSTTTETTFLNYNFNSENLRQILTSGDGKLFACNICDKSFKVLGNLTIHLRTHTEDKLFLCNLCDKKFPLISQLNRHMRTHTDEKPFVCEICQKSFSLITYLKKHMRTHTGERPHKCNVCDKRFLCTDILKKHMRIHTGEKPYKCEICEKRFKQSSILSVHLKTHTGEKPHGCTFCKKRFKKRSHLATHMNTHTKKSLRCELCDERFSKKSQLKEHMKMHP